MRKLVSDVRYNKDKSLSIIYCKSCGFHHLNYKFYNRDNENYYLEDKFYTEHSPSGWLKKEIREHRLGLWDSYYNFQIKMLDVPNLPIIDVGCGTGGFVDFCTRKGYRAYGIEPSPSARHEGKSPYVYPSIERLKPLLEHIYSSVSYNIHMSLVLEHIQKPKQFIEEYYDFFGELGNLMIVVPNEMNPLQEKYCKNNFLSSVHYNYFTPKTLKSLLEKCGLEVIRESATFPMELFLALGFNYIGNDKLGKKLHMFRLKLEKVFPFIFYGYQYLYKKYGWGREIIFVARRA